MKVALEYTDESEHETGLPFRSMHDFTRFLYYKNSLKFASAYTYIEIDLSKQS